MIVVGNKLLSEDIFEVQFSCDIGACQGACCVEGSGGAPLSEEECAILDDIFDDIKPYLRKEGIDVIEKEGLFVVGRDGTLETPLIEDRACVYTTISKNGNVLCGIEQAHREGKIEWKKPISCHLYPIRIKELIDFTALNYHKWSICNSALSCGIARETTVLEFCKEALVRRFGLEWYEEALKTMKVWIDEKNA
ncbi:MAG: hypothetical protein COA49_07910 [Bacteroidetes bacterium]|nr:MAG: hypothetical protein COA49_07910 [Bacteroidota bacterium]